MSRLFQWVWETVQPHWWQSKYLLSVFNDHFNEDVYTCKFTLDQHHVTVSNTSIVWQCITRYVHFHTWVVEKNAAVLCAPNYTQKQCFVELLEKPHVIIPFEKASEKHGHSIADNMPYSTLFRSEEMSLIQLYIPYEVAQPTVSYLGELGLIEFRDLNPDVNAFQRAFVQEIRRLDDMERRLRFLSEQITKEDLVMQPVDLELATAAGSYLSRPRTAQEMDDLEAAIVAHEQRVQQMNASYHQLLKRQMELLELKNVVRETAALLSSSPTDEEVHPAGLRNSTEINPNDDHLPLLRAETGGVLAPNTMDGTVGFVAGVLLRHRMPTFERVLWRALRGNLYMNYAEIEDPLQDPETELPINKNVFVIFAHGKDVLAKIRKLAESLGATLYPVDSDPVQRRDRTMEIMTRLDDIKSVIDTTHKTRKEELATVAENVQAWMTVVRKEKAIYHTMNEFNYDRTRRCLIAEGWCPRNQMHEIQTTLRKATEQANGVVPSIMTELPTNKTPPTYHRVNKFTSGFQDIVDSYGIASYGEVNPGLFAIITFPFLFAVMFGDFGHGVIMTLMAGYICWKEKALARYTSDEMFSMVYGGRYIILLMGIFSMYTGIIYNDCFSLAMHIFPSGWTYIDVKEGQPAEAVQIGTYPVGLDWNWHGTENALIFTNSYKMKMAVLFGVVQMTFGILLTAANHIHFKRKNFIWAETLPQLLFFLCLFGYLGIMIIWKWTTDWYAKDANGNPLYNSPPGLLNMLIYMFLSPGNVKPEDQMYRGQGLVQAILVLVAVICVPWMLLAKPLLEKREHEHKKRNGYVNVATHHTPSVAAPTSHGEHPELPRIETNQTGYSVASSYYASGVVGAEASMIVPAAIVPPEEMEQEHEFDFGEIMIHQVIHTIETCLGAISNTASYLRLWALSLAHARAFFSFL